MGKVLRVKRMRKISNAANHDSSITYDGFPLDLTELKKSNVLVTGTNSTGKSLTAIQLCDILMREGWQCVAVDSSGAWRNKSSIQTFYTVSETTMRYVLPTEESMVFDVSLLLPSYQREFLENILNDIWQWRVKNQPRKWLMIFLEESHLYMRNIRGMVSQSLLRMCSVGRNYKTRVCAISPSLTGIDKEFVRLSSQRYHFKISPEQHSLRRYRSYYGSDWVRVLRALDTGYCIYYLNEKMQVYKIPLFHSRTLPQPYVEPKEPIPEKKSIIRRIVAAISGKEETEAYDYEEEYEREQEQNREDEDFLLEW